MFGKIFTQMYDGTLATKGPWQALVTFQQLIVLADRDGAVDMTPEAISRRTTVPLDIINIGITALEQPDPDSRTPDLEGRRIIRLSESRPWGWSIVNYEHYRKIRSAEDRREYHRVYQSDRRKLLSVDNVDSKQCQQESTKSTNSSKHRHKNLMSASPPSGSNAIAFSPEDGFQGITPVQSKAWSVAYPAIDLNVELAKAVAWLVANPKNRKSNWPRFLNGWFSRAQDRAPAQGGGAKPPVFKGEVI